AVDVDIAVQLAAGERVERALALAGLVALLVRVEVVTSREALALAGEHDHPALRIGDGVVEGGLHLAEHPPALGVLALGPVEGDASDPTGLVDHRVQIEFAHRPPLETP